MRDVSLGKALLEKAIEQGRSAELFTDAQVEMVIAYLDQIYEKSEAGEQPAKEDVRLVHRIANPDIRKQLADFLRQSAHDDMRLLEE